MTTLHPFERLFSQSAVFNKPHIFQVDGEWLRVNTPTDTHVPGRFVDTGEWMRDTLGAMKRTTVDKEDPRAQLAIAKRATRHHRAN